MSKIPANKSDEIRSWLNSINTNSFKVDDEVESCTSEVESKILESSSSSESGEELALGETTYGTTQCSAYENILPQMPALIFNNVNISNSTNVYMGHIYNVKGTLNVNVIKSDERLQEDDNLSNKELSHKQPPVNRPACLIFPRYRWLAMDPLCDTKKVAEPVEIVIIGYTATTSSTIQAINIGIIRDYQTLNVEAQGFNDIIFNFLIGCDGVVYEGRGWGVEGDHTNGYNHKSIGVAFVGYFKRDLPTERALKACRNLFIRGVTEGHISKNYKILTSCQCSPNPSFSVFGEEFKKWDNFYDLKKTLNVEAQGFNDIIFNFLIGCDGVVYEGRGWGVEGDHTNGYNHKSIGVAFVGYFKRDLPAERALKACRNLFIRGVTEGHISKNYKILTSCQCSPNPSFSVFGEEFKKWDNFYDLKKAS